MPSKPTPNKPRNKLSKVEFKYWKLWRLYCLKFGEKTSNRDARIGCHLRALGYEKSSKLFTPKEYDLVFAFFTISINGLNWEKFNQIESEIHGEKRRKIYRILSDAPHGYVQAVASNKFHCANWQNLPLNQLEQLRITIIERARSKARKGASLYDNFQVK